MRGDVYRLRAPRDAQDHEQRGPRYAVVVQSDAVLRSTVLVAPTSHSARSSTVRPEIDINGITTRVVVEQTSAISTNRLGDFAGRLDAHEITEIDEAIRIVFGLI